ncbi:helix-turn-helix domain-containing protein [Clostridium sp. AWRP]|uniref:winged helix-turn-helix transcriptional regulator n=1 Tax=Clostridium sp. AWRP TaxID=2212991 RepID=UPI000FD8F60A|nr:helix-turn-helix domain-containing protein [Clostridium sp. AWRP]AZV57868.1 helix-turn-helix transcriptional regulator [Clostridium sp. AWRP]
MARILKNPQSNKSCPIAAVQYLISGKWKMIILFHLNEKTRRFNELQRLCKGISQPVLTKQLRELEDDGMVHREIYKEVPPRVEYSLTKMGRSFIPVLKNMGEWGKIYINSMEENE